MRSLYQLLREASQASADEDFNTAAAIYQDILDCDGMNGDIDIQLRLAGCHERAGKINDACSMYQEIIRKYENMNDNQAATSLKELVSQLQRSERPMFVRPTYRISEAALIDELISMGEMIHLKPKEILCNAGDPPHTLWLLRRGKLRFKMKGYEDEPDIAYTDEGGVMLVGEIGVFTQQQRSATVWSEQHADLSAIPISAIRQRQKTDLNFNAAMERLILERWAEPIITRHALFDRINDIYRKQIARSFEPVEFKSGHCLVDLGGIHDACYLVQTGCLFFLDTRLEDTETKAKLLAYALPGDVIHSGGLLREFNSPNRIMAGTNVRLLRLSRVAFEPFTLQRPWLIQALIRQSRRPSHQQVLRPDDDYLWTTNRHIQLRKASKKK